MMVRRGSIGIALLAIASACTTALSQHTPSTAPVTLSRLRDGSTAFSSYAGIADPVRTVIKDSVAWRALWERLHRPFVPQPRLPPIDFGREMIVVAALGSRPSGGYDVVIESAERDSTGLQISVRVAAPASGCPVESVMTQPVDIARVPLTSQPVRFRERDVVIGCSSP